MEHHWPCSSRKSYGSKSSWFSPNDAENSSRTPSIASVDPLPGRPLRSAGDTGQVFLHGTTPGPPTPAPAACHLLHREGAGKVRGRVGDIQRTRMHLDHRASAGRCFLAGMEESRAAARSGEQVRRRPVPVLELSRRWCNLPALAGIKENALHQPLHGIQKRQGVSTTPR